MADEVEKPPGGVSWSVLATLMNYRCEACGKTIVYEDRELYFRTKSCRSCHESEEHSWVRS